MRFDNGSPQAPDEVVLAGPQQSSGGRGYRRPAAVGGGGIGIGLLVAVLVAVFGGGGGGGFGSIDSGLGGMAPAQQSRTPVVSLTEESQVEFLNQVVTNIQNFWGQEFAASNQQYQRTTLVIFQSLVSTGCGQAEASTGPFYCPADNHVYLDLSFFRELQGKLGAPGDFAQAYVVAHEFGHHVQNLLGTSAKVDRYVQDNGEQANEVSVAVELQADCYAGVWGHSTQEQGILEPGDLEEGLQAASSVGDDVLQKRATGYVDPERFTHGSAEQRRDWFTRGFESGDPDVCTTFEDLS